MRRQSFALLLATLATVSCARSDDDTAKAEELARIATDDGASREKRLLAIEDLRERKVAKVAGLLFEAGRFEPDFAVRNGLFDAAAASGGEVIFTAMAEHYASHQSKAYRNGLRSALRANFSGKQLFAWASENYPADEARQPWVADLVIDAKGAADKSKVAELMSKTKHPMAFHRLAVAAVRLGDDAKITVLIEGLSLGDDSDRSDAAVQLAKVADQIPDDKTQAVIDVAKAAKAKGARGLAARGYDDLLTKLQAE